ncbi:MAG: hypothetical protein M3478_11280 [Planctomycetota bacterium]|nr:hypothetical protein [Planctomycetota bacterium]
MPVYHFTIHAYRDWRPDHPRGYAKRGRGYQLPDPDEADKYDERAKQDRAEFSRDVQALLIRTAHDFCARRRFRLLGVGNELGHVHVIIGWRSFCAWDEVLRRLKNVLTTTLNRHFNAPGRRWFARGGSRKRVQRRSHLDHLLDPYLPDHRGLFWRAGKPLP